MKEALFVFVAGLSGVFVGMAVLYLAIRVVAPLASRIEARGQADG